MQLCVGCTSPYAVAHTPLLAHQQHELLSKQLASSCQQGSVMQASGGAAGPDCDRQEAHSTRGGPPHRHRGERNHLQEGHSEARSGPCKLAALVVCLRRDLFMCPHQSLLTEFGVTAVSQHIAQSMRCITCITCVGLFLPSAVYAASRVQLLHLPRLFGGRSCVAYQHMQLHMSALYSQMRTASGCGRFVGAGCNGRDSGAA